MKAMRTEFEVLRYCNVLRWSAALRRHHNAVRRDVNRVKTGLLVTFQGQIL
jgi:hypothetical protein